MTAPRDIIARELGWAYEKTDRILAALRAVGGDRIALVWTKTVCERCVGKGIRFEPIGPGLSKAHECDVCRGEGFTEAPTLHRLERTFGSMSNDRDAWRLVAAVEAPVAPTKEES